MIFSPMEAALRSLLVAMAVWAGLRVFRVSNVVAQKAAWGLVLASAVLMPVLLPYAARLSVLPSRAALVLPPDPETLLGKIREQMRPAPVPVPLSQSPRQSLVPSTPQPVVSNLPEPETDDAEDSAAPSVSTPSIAARIEAGSAAAPQPSTLSKLGMLPWKRFAFRLYAAVVAFIIFRLLFGLLKAFRIWRAARPVSLTDTYAAGLRLRSSAAVSSPVTIGSSVVLPLDFESWDSEKLRIVLAHERSHIRQGDFYLQLLAGLYAALFWFSPLGWWLKCKLSDLAEAISDHAGLQQAASRSSYAQVLLEFAAAPRPILIGVAMARSGSISRRIERLLNDRSFHQAFAGNRRRALIATLLVPAALLAATSMIRVQAASQAPGNVPSQALDQVQPPSQPVAPAKPEAPISGISTPEQPSDATAPSSAQAPSSGKEPQSVAPQVAPPAPPTQAGPHAPSTPVSPVVVTPEIAPRVVVVPPMPRIEVHVPHIDSARIRAQVEAATAAARNGYRYSFDYSQNGDSYGVVRGNGEHVRFSGNMHTADIDKIRKQAHGDFLWFNRDGKSYFIDDPATLKQVEEMYKPMEDLGKQQEELGRQQRELGEQQRELAHQQREVAVPTPDMNEEIAKVEEALAKLKANQGKSMTQQQFGEIQRKLGELQRELGRAQGQMGAKQGEFGAKMGALGAEQGKLGAQQGRLGAEQGRLAQQADQKVKSIIDESLKNGKAHPVD
jgi:beta-lactamase regulating signal transducer with metallopeptidase domain